MGEGNFGLVHDKDTISSALVLNLSLQMLSLTHLSMFRPGQIMILSSDVHHIRPHRANRFSITLHPTRLLRGSPTFQQVLLKLLGSDEEVAIAKEIQKAVRQIPGVCPRALTSLPGPGVTH